MLRLLKYDWKRNANLSLGLLAILVFLQIVIGVVGNTRNWEQSVIFVLSFMLYAMTGLILIILASKTYENNMKAYSRRLLPIRPMWTAISSIVLMLLFAAVLGAIAFIHYWIYSTFVYSGSLWPQELAVTDGMDWFKIIFITGWSLTFLMMSILVSMTIGASVSLRGKAGTWVGILAFIVIQYVLSWVEYMLFRGYDTMRFNVGIIEYSNKSVNAEVMSNIPILSVGQLLFGGAIIVLMLVLINYLMNKKVEI